MIGQSNCIQPSPPPSPAAGLHFHSEGGICGLFCFQLPLTLNPSPGRGLSVLHLAWTHFALQFLGRANHGSWGPRVGLGLFGAVPAVQCPPPTLPSLQTISYEIKAKPAATEFTPCVLRTPVSYKQQPLPAPPTEPEVPASLRAVRPREVLHSCDLVLSVVWGGSP